MPKKRRHTADKSSPTPAKQTPPESLSGTPVERKPARRSPFTLDRILVYATALVLFGIPLFIWPGITEYGYGKTMLLIIAVSLLSVLWGVSAWRKGKWELRLPWIVFPVVGMVLASLLSLVNATNGRVVIQSLALVITFAQLGLIIANIVREKRDVSLLLGAVVGSAFLASLYALLQHLGVMAGVPGQVGLNSIISTVGNRNFLGGFIGYLLLPSFVLVLRPRSPILRVLALVAIAFNFGMLMIVQQLAPLVGLAAAVVFLIVGLVMFRPIEPIRRNRGWLIALLAMLIFTFLVEAPSGPLNSVVGLSQDSTGWATEIWQKNSGRVRELDWWIGLEMFKSSPLTGVGLGNYKLRFLSAKASFLSSPGGVAYEGVLVSRAAQAHNDYVQAIAELGVLGILAVIGFFGVGAVALWLRLRRNPDEGDRLDLLLLACGLIVFFVHALVSFPAHLPVSSMMVVLLAGLIFAPAYGETATVSARIRKPVKIVAIGIMAVAGIVVSVFAIADMSANVLMGRGIDKLHLGETLEAKELFERSIALDFAPRQTYYYLGSALVRLGQLEEALATYEKCFTRFVDENLYSIYAEMAMRLGETQEALEAIEFLLSTNPPSPIREQARYQQASVAIALRDYNGATRLLESLVEDAPEYETALIGLANLYQGLGQNALAVEAYERALAVVGKKTVAIEAEIAAKTSGTAQEFGQLSQTRTSLRQERAFILEQLEALAGE